MQLLGRYLLDNNILNNLDKSYKKNTVIEFPTQINECKSIFYQKIENEYFKIKIINNKIINKKKISKKLYLKKRKYNSLSDIKKKEIYIINKNSTITVDNNIIYLETNKKKTINKYKSYFKDNLNYKKNILPNQKEYETNIFKIFKKLEKMENIEMNNILKKEPSINNIVRIKLYELYIKLSQKKLDLLDKELYLIDTISSYKNIVLSIIVLLKEFKNIFEKELYFKVIENLNYLIIKTEPCKRTKSITKRLKGYKSCLNNEQYIEFLQQEDKSITNNIDIFLHFLQTREYYIIMKQLEILIKENTIEHALSDVADFDILLNKSIKKRYKKIYKTVKKHIDCEDKKSYIKIYKQIEKLYILNKEFSTFFSQKKYYKRKQILSRLKNDFNNCIEIKINEEITKINFKNTELNCIIKYLEKLKRKRIKAIQKNMKDFKKSKKLFVS